MMLLVQRIVVSPELADVLSAVITRVRDSGGGIPLVSAYDPHEAVWNPPMPLLFQWHWRLEDRPLSAGAVRRLLNDTLAGSGLTDASRAPLRFTPHDFRRLFITDAEWAPGSRCAMCKKPPPRP